MDAFELLKADHKKVAELFDLLETASGKKLDVFKRIKCELDLHTHIEEKIFDPAIEKPEETHESGRLFASGPGSLEPSVTEHFVELVV